MKFSSAALTLALIGGASAVRPKRNLRKQNRQRNLKVPPEHEREFAPRIVGGTDTGVGEYPFFTLGYGCGASLIWKDILLTAAHCQGYIADPIYNDVLVGAHERDVDSDTSDFVGFGYEVPHPEYDGYVYKDYMIVKLSETVTNPDIAYVGLAGDTTTLTEGEPLTVMGMGALSEGGPTSDILQEVDVDYVSQNQCEAVYGYTGLFDDEFMFCAGGTPAGGTDSCQGDSGGPIINDEGYQVGVVSWGEGCARPGTPGVYSTVAAEIDWIKAMVCLHSDDPPEWACNADASPVPPTYDVGSGGTPVTTPPPPTPGNAQWQLAPGSVGCEIVNNCIQTSSSPYNNYEQCSFGVTGTATVTVENFCTEGYFDYMTYNSGDRISGCDADSGAALNGLTLTPADTLTWYADYSITYAGWRMCLEEDGNPAPDNVDYYLVVAYDIWAAETEVKVEHVSTGQTIELFPANSQPNFQYIFQFEELDLVPGETYKLTVTDTYGDGMYPGYVGVDAFVDDEWNSQFAFIAGDEFTFSAEQTFTVPASGARASKTAPRHNKLSKTRSFCADTATTFDVNGTQQTCAFIAAEFDKVGELCDRADVAYACPGTCGNCAKAMGGAPPQKVSRNDSGMKLAKAPKSP